MSEPFRWDALFVLNRLSPLPRVARLARGCRAGSVLIVSTHHAFPGERAALAALLPPGTRLEWLIFADLIDDRTAAETDEETTRELVPVAATLARTGRYADRYQACMTTRKNQRIAAALRQAHAWGRGWCDDGLGLAPDAWASFGTRRLSLPRLRPLLARLKPQRPPRPLPGSHPVRTFLDESGRAHVFIGEIKRVPTAPDAQVVHESLETALARPGPVFIATTIHDHSPAALSLGRPVRVFADGFLPSNYPRSYLDGYGDAEFVPADPFSARWFRKLGVRCVAPPSFIRSAQLRSPLPVAGVARVCVLLGHAGDWCAIINRSDTDVLVAAALALGERHPEIEFRLRAHPTMDHPSHEGAGARQRLAEAVGAAGLPNVVLSTGALSEDLAGADLCLSEYSATLIDAWRGGRLGLIVNLTGRRSFMADYEELGYPVVGSTAALEAFFADTTQSVAELRHRQEQAAERHNALIDRWRLG